MAKLFTYITLFTILTLMGCERDNNAESYLYQEWQVNHISIDGVDKTLECDSGSWIRLHSNNRYDAHNDCSKTTITNIPYTYDNKTNSISLSSLSDAPFYIVHLDATNLVLEQKKEGDIIYRCEYVKK